MALQPGRPIRAAEVNNRSRVLDSQRTSTMPAVGSITTTETLVQSGSFVAQPGVTYEVTAQQSVQGDAAGGSAVVRLRWALGGSVANTDAIIDAKTPPFNTAGLGTLISLEGEITPIAVGGVAAQITIGAFVIRNTGAANITSFGGAGQINRIRAKGVAT